MIYPNGTMFRNADADVDARIRNLTQGRLDDWQLKLLCQEVRGIALEFASDAIDETSERFRDAMNTTGGGHV